MRLVLGLLIGFSLLAWAGTIHWGMRMGSMRSYSMPMGAAFFVTMWGVMQVAMMFPSVGPMVLSFVSISQRQAGPHYLRTAAFIFGYVVVWTLSGALAYLLWLVLQEVGARSEDSLRVVSAAILIGAGFYQLTPLKYRCLSHCRSPLSFFIEHPVGRSLGSGLQLGLYHGAFCVACCWALMGVLFAVGVMNLAWMGMLTLVIFVEKIHRRGPLIGRAIGIALIGLGFIFLVGPPSLRQFLLGP
jgi:predicted metal-binding membrane protein